MSDAVTDSDKVPATTTSKPADTGDSPRRSRISKRKSSKGASALARVNYGKLQEVLAIPNLVDVQTRSYQSFLQEGVPPEKRDPTIGLESVFRSAFPIESPAKDMVLEYVAYTLGEPRYSESEARRKETTYTVPLRATIRLIFTETGEVREKEIFFGDIPMMTPRGTFVVNGAERVVVSQIHKSPGVVFSYDPRKSAFVSKIIPDKGAWLEFELDVKKELMYIKIDRKKRVPVTSLLRAIGYESNEDIIRMFCETKKIKVDQDLGELSLRLAENLNHPKTDEMVYEAGSELLPLDIEKLQSFSVREVEVVDPDSRHDASVITNTLDKDTAKTKDEALLALYEAVRVGESVTMETVRKEFERLFFDSKRYNLGNVGRYKFNQKIYDHEADAPEGTTLTPLDIAKATDYLIRVYNREYKIDDIDHLANRRIRSIGELLGNQLKLGFSRMERAIKERMGVEDVNDVTPQRLVNIKPVMSSIKEFFASSQLSQFMDQTNPLAELTHKRRLNALGPGGLSRDRAGFEVRDVHYTHYGRMCPIETPEGPNIGLILSLTNYASINEYGFIVTPYRVVKDGRVQNTFKLLTAIEEEKYRIAQANAGLDASNKFTDAQVLCRHRGEFVELPGDEVNFMDVSPKQIVSVSTALIPFLEHDDANRALMGSNMQRQAVPLLYTDSPVVGTGMEARAAIDSGVCLTTRRDGRVIKVSNTEIHVEVPEDAENPVDVYTLIKNQRTNQSTYFNQKARVHAGDKVSAGDLLADGPACQDGELALGKNVLIAFMPWYGYNYQDAIIVSQRVVREEAFTSVHIEQYQVDARETKIGEEKITADIPNLPEEAFRDLDEDGIVRIGAHVRAGDVLVGKVTPKAETDLTPEYKLLYSIFGEKAKEVRDTSLRVPHGSKGTVIGVQVLSREQGDELPPGVQKSVRVQIAHRSRLQEGDKMAGRHGNKGVVSVILPEEDMPFMPDGTPIDVILSPLGVPSRMNIGQLFETLFGFAASREGIKVATPVFEGATLDEIKNLLEKHELPTSGKSVLYDGRTGEPFDEPISVGVMYILKLNHLVDDKLHARSTGPYSLVTQQPLGGRAQFGGQRLGEMEVWALEAYGAANILEEFLTIKSDDMIGRSRMYESIVKEELKSDPGVPESFNVLLQELRGLCLDMNIYDAEGRLIGLTDKDEEIIRRAKSAL